MSKLFFAEKELNTLRYNVNQRMNEQDKTISKVKGWIEAINFFKGKKGALDPITLIVVVIIIILIILYMQGKI